MTPAGREGMGPREVPVGSLLMARPLAPGLANPRAGLPISYRDRRSVRPAGGLDLHSTRTAMHGASASAGASCGAEPPLPLLALGAFAGGVLGGLMWLTLAWLDFWVVVGLATLARYGWR